VQNAGVRDRVQRLLEQHASHERMLDAYWQWATNPTPPSAGYALEENCGFIATNLLVRYGEPGISLVIQLSDESREMRQDASVYDIQQAIIEVLNGPVGQALRDGIVRRLTEEQPARRFLSAWLASRARWNFRHGKDAWLGGEFDWSMGQDLQRSATEVQAPVAAVLYGPEVMHVDLAREGLVVGIVNRLFYRSASGHVEPRVRPGPRIPLAQITY
jgi:hypothetical protein